MNKIFKAAAAAAGIATMIAGAVVALDAPAFDGDKLDAVLDAQPDKIKARYKYRHPRETLEFFGVAPGMTVVDTTAGEYYSRILLPYLGDDGALVGASYALSQREIDYKDNEARMKRYRAWPEKFVKDADAWRAGSKAKVSTFLFESMPNELDDSVDVFMMLRAAHHLNKYEDNGMRRSKALADVYRALKPGGVFGVVQHRAPEGNSDKWARGFEGYIKEAPFIEAVKAAGFEFIGSSEINANSKDQPTETDYVWRLPPVLHGMEEGSPERAAMEAIGESDRMTLKFRKPS